MGTTDTEAFQARSHRPVLLLVVTASPQSLPVRRPRRDWTSGIDAGRDWTSLDPNDRRLSSGAAARTSFVVE